MAGMKFSGKRTWNYTKLITWMLCGCFMFSAVDPETRAFGIACATLFWIMTICTVIDTLRKKRRHK